MYSHKLGDFNNDKGKKIGGTGGEEMGGIKKKSHLWIRKMMWK